MASRTNIGGEGGGSHHEIWQTKTNRFNKPSELFDFILNDIRIESMTGRNMKDGKVLEIKNKVKRQG